MNKQSNRILEQIGAVASDVGIGRSNSPRASIDVVVDDPCRTSDSSLVDMTLSNTCQLNFHDVATE